MSMPRRRELVPASVVNQSHQSRREANLAAWRLCEKLTIHQAALLIVGEDPTDIVWESDTPGYVPWVAAIVAAAESGIINGVGKFKSVMRSDGTFFPGDKTDPFTSTIEVASLKLWLSAKGQRPSVFFPEVTESSKGPSAVPPCLDKEHPRFAPKLAAAIAAWEAMNDPNNLKASMAPRQALVAWLTQNAPLLGLVDQNGKPNKLAIKEISKIANWNTQGGAPRTGGKLSRRGDLAPRPL